MKKHIVSPLRKSLLACACASTLMLGAAAHATSVGNVFYILLENRNFSAGTDTSGGQTIVGNTSEAPYLNSLITPNNGISTQVSYCSCYHNDLSTTSGANSSIHPSEPNYVWMESGNNLSKADDNDPYGSGASVLQIQNYLSANPSLSGQHLCGLLQAAGISWKSYQEGIDHLTTASNNINVTPGSNDITNTVAATNLWTVPLQSFSGTATGYVNPYNGSHQYNFACKHNGSIFYLDTNGSTITTANYAHSNPETNYYAPLEQLSTDLTNNTVARYNVITPDQYNDMHTALSSGITYNGTHWTGDSAQIAQGDNFLSQVVPLIMASPAYGNNGVIVIWTDETEGTNQNDFNHTLTEIVISPLAKGNAYNSLLNYTHSSDIATMQEIFQVPANTPTGYLNDAANISNSSNGLAGSAAGFGTGTALDLSDLFQSGVIPSSLPALRAVAGGYSVNGRARTATQVVTVTNVLSSAITTPVYLVVANPNTALNNQGQGITQNTAPVGAAYVTVSSNGLAPGASASVTLQYTEPSSGSISAILTPITTGGQP